MLMMKIVKLEHSLVGPEVIADLLKVSRNTVLNWAKSGKIPAIRVGKTYRFSLKKVSESIKHELVLAA